MNTSDLVEWQIIDPDSGLCYPWLTHPFLAALKSWDIKDKRVLEMGGGRSTAWWRFYSKWVHTIDTNVEWAGQADIDCRERKLTNGIIHCAEIPDGIQGMQGRYFRLAEISAFAFDIIVIDGIFRTEACQWAVDYAKKRIRSTIIIADNWQQDFVWISPKAEEIMAPYQIHKFVQPTHTNHEGRPWTTVYWEIQP